MHYILEANSASDPVDPLAYVEAMMCEGATTKDITDGMLVLSNSVCMPQTCGVTPNGCVSRLNDRSLEKMETLIDSDDEDDRLLRRYISSVRNICLSKFKALLTPQFSDSRDWR